MYCLHGELKLYQYNNPEKQGPRREIVCGLPSGFADDPEERGYRIDPIMDEDDDPSDAADNSASHRAAPLTGKDYEKEDTVNHLVFVVHGIGEELWFVIWDTCSIPLVVSNTSGPDTYLSHY